MPFSWETKTPRVLLSMNGSVIDPQTISHWREEGYTVSYLPFSGSRKDYAAALHAVAAPFGFGEEFALVGRLDADPALAK